MLLLFFWGRSLWCTPLIVAVDGHSIIVATNTIDTEGRSHCKLHFSQNVVVVRAIQAASLTFVSPNGSIERIDFERELDDLLRNSNLSVESLEKLIVEEIQAHVLALFERFKLGSLERRQIANSLESEYVIVGKKKNGFLGIRVFLFKVLDPEQPRVVIRDLDTAWQNGELIDFSEGQRATYQINSRKDTTSAIYSLLQAHSESAMKFGNKSFSSPFSLVRVMRSGFSFLSAPGVCQKFPR